MKLIIEVDDKDKEICEQYVNGKLGDELCDYVNVTEIAHAIANGTPLPKGHGDLIDRSKLVYYRCPNNVKNCPPSYDFTCNSCDYGITHKFRVDREEAVIPADKENDNA